MTADNVWFTLDGFSLTFDSTADVDLLVDKDPTDDKDSLFYNGRQKPPSAQQCVYSVPGFRSCVLSHVTERN